MGDLYRGEMSLRKLWNCIQSLPLDSPLIIQLEHDRAAAEAQSEIDSLDATLDMMRRP